MSIDCDELQEELLNHEEKSRKLFNEAEELHQKALQTSSANRIQAMIEAFAKQREAMDEIRAVVMIKNKVKEAQCDDTPNQSSDWRSPRTSG